MAKLTKAEVEKIKTLLDEHGELPRELRWTLFPPERQEAELVYAGKRREEDIFADVMAVPLQPMRSFGEQTGGWHNKLIFGDNLQALRALADDPNIVEKVKLIYIDPPFATRRDFQGSQEQKAYQDKIVGAEFLEFIRKRLVLLRDLLAEDGSIFVHLDQRKVHPIKVLMDEVFRENNFRNEIIVPGRASKNLQQQFETVSKLNIRHDTLLWYSKSPRTRFATFWVDKHNVGNTEGHWHHFWSTADRPTMRYALFGVTPDRGQWTWKEERAKKAIANYERYLEEAGGRTLAEYWRDTGEALEFVRQSPDDGSPQYWRAPAETRLADTIWSGVPVYSNQTQYPTEKSEALLSHIIEMASEEGDLVLDAFAGSGTTCAVAEKMRRRWIGVDCGKLSIYTVQKRILSLREGIGQKGKSLKPTPFTQYHAGLYDFASLKKLDWEGWRFFALQLFECKDRKHVIGRLPVDGERRGSPVLVFNWKEHSDEVISEETIDDIHAAIGDKVGRRFYIIAPMLAFDFYQDYIDRDGVRYYALRIPYQFINELHNRDFQAVLQARDADEVNDIQDAYGFSFIVPPDVEFEVGLEAQRADMFDYAFIKTTSFVSHARIKGTERDIGIEGLALLLIDLDYDGNVFNMSQSFYGQQLEGQGWIARLNPDHIGRQMMAVWVDYHGNEFKVVIKREDLGLEPIPEGAVARDNGRKRRRRAEIASREDAVEA
jgi:DNA modification methylase